MNNFTINLFVIDTAIIIIVIVVIVIIIIIIIEHSRFFVNSIFYSNFCGEILYKIFIPEHAIIFVKIIWKICYTNDSYIDCEKNR